MAYRHGLQPMSHGIAYGLWPMAWPIMAYSLGRWPIGMAYGLWPVAYGLWPMAYGL